MRVALTPVEQAVAFASLCLALYASPLLLWTSASDWQFLLKWDDAENIVDNDTVQPPLTLAKLRRMWTMGLINVYEPFGWMLKALVIQIVGMDAWWMRVVTLVLHIAACGVLARVSIMLIELVRVLDVLSKPFNSRHSHKIDSDKLKAACLMSAALFAVHPVHVQVVAWPSAQPYALAALFANLAIYVYLRPLHSAVMSNYRSFQVAVKLGKPLKSYQWTYDKAVATISRQGGSWSRAMILTVLYTCSILSKSVSILLPAAFILLDALAILKSVTSGHTYPLKAFATYAVRKLPLALVFVAFSFITVSFNINGSGEYAGIMSLSLSERIVKALGTPTAVMVLMLWPTKLRPHYQVRTSQFADIWSPDNLIPISALVLVTWISLRRCRPPHNQQQHAVALTYFVLMLLPVSGLVQHGAISGTSDRYAYFSTIPLVSYVGAALYSWMYPSHSQVNSTNQESRCEGDHPESMIPMQGTKEGFQHRWALLGSVSAVLLLISTQLIAVWRSEKSLYNYAARMDPFDWRELDHLEYQMATHGECALNLDLCATLRLRSILNVPGKTLKAELFRLSGWVSLKGRDVLEEVCAKYDLLDAEYPRNSLVLNNLAVCRVFGGKIDEAHILFERALKFSPFEGMREQLSRNVAAFEAWDRLRRLHPYDDLRLHLNTYEGVLVH